MKTNEFDKLLKGIVKELTTMQTKAGHADRTVAEVMEEVIKKNVRKLSNDENTMPYTLLSQALFILIANLYLNTVGGE